MTETLFTATAPCRKCGRPSDGECPWCASAATGTAAGHAAAAAAGDADPEFMDAAARALAAVRRRGDDFTAAEVRAVLAEWGVAISRPQALGAVFGTFHALGVIRPTGEFRPSPIKGQHGRPLRVWRAA